MKKLLAILLFLTITTKFSYSQDDDMQIIMDSIFSPLDVSLINTGYLYDKTIHYSNFEFYDGVEDSISTQMEIRRVWQELRNMRTTTQSMITVGELDSLLEIKRSNNINEIVIFNYKYNFFTDTTFDAPLIDTINGRLYDHYPRFRTPYDEERLLLIGPDKECMGFGPITFELLHDFYFSNFNSGYFPTVYVDFDDGNGFRLFNWGTQITVSYQDNREHVIKFKLKEYGDNYYFASSLARSLGISNPVTISSSLPSGCVFNENTLYPVGGAVTVGKEVYTGLAYMHVKFANGNHSGNLKKPMIFVEGIDFGFKGFEKGVLTGFPQCGSNGFYSFYNTYEIDYDPEHGSKIKDYSTTAAQQTFLNKHGYDYPYRNVKYLIDSITAEGYDFIYVDFNYGADYMQNNAAALKGVIDYVNGCKTSCEENVVVGASMGGQVARYALTYMEYKRERHDSKAFYSFDSPNNGANIPIGFQHLVNFFADRNTFHGKGLFGDFYDARERKLNAPAAKQLLVKHHLGNYGPTAERTIFLNELTSMGEYPHNLRKFAFANGSGFGEDLRNVMKDGDDIFRMNLTIYDIVTSVGKPAKKGIRKAFRKLFHSAISKVIVNFISNVLQISTPLLAGYNGTAYADKIGGGTVFVGKKLINPVSVTKSTSGTSLAGYAFDNIPGGTHGALDDANKLNPITKIPSGKFFNFIPTVSSLGLRSPYNLMLSKDWSGTIQRNIYLGYNNYSYFDYFYYPEANQQHVETFVDFSGPLKGNVNKFIESLRNHQQNQYPLDVSIPSSKGYTYNFNKNSDNLLKDITINNNGKLFINAKKYGGYNNLNVGISNNYTVITSKCAQVIVDNLGTIEIGDGNNGFLGTLVLKPGSSITLKAGGKLIVNENSKLIVEPGAYFIYDGGEIYLNGSNAVFEIQGNLIVNDNKTFTVKYANNNTGIVKFSDSNNGTPTIIPGYNSKFLIKGAAKTDKVMEVASSNLVFENSFSLVKFNNALIDYTVNNATMSVYSPADVQLCQFVGNFQNSNLNSTATALKLYGQSNITISKVDMMNLKNGIINYVSGQTILNISNSKFISCEENGITQYSAGINLNNCQFTSCGYGLAAKYFTQNSLINNCNFNYSTYSGIKANGNNSTDFKIEKTIIQNSGDFGLVITDGLNTILRCSKINNNYAGILLGLNASLNASTLNGSGYSEISNNETVNIFCQNARTLNILKGYNDIRKNQSGGYVIQGTLQHINCIKPLLNVSSNRWSATQLTGTSFNNLFSLTTTQFSLSCQITSIKLIDVDQQFKLTPCGFYDSPNCAQPPCIDLPSEIKSCPTCQSISTLSYLNEKTNIAVEDEVNHINNLSASVGIERAYEILMFNYQYIHSDEEKRVLDYSTRKMEHAFAIGIRENQIVSPSNSVEKQKLIDVSESRRNKAISQNDFETQLYEQSSRMNIVHISKDFANTYSEINSLKNNVEYYETMDAWNCYTHAEEAFLSNMKQSFEGLLQNCGSAKSNQGRFSDNIQNELNENLKKPETSSKLLIYPNPSSEEINLNLENSEELQTVEIYNSLGLLVRRLNVEKNNININVEDLKPGIYNIVCMTKENRIVYANFAIHR